MSDSERSKETLFQLQIVGEFLIGTDIQKAMLSSGSQMKTTKKMVQTSVNNAGDSIVSLSGSKPTVRPDEEAIFSGMYLLTTGGFCLKHGAEHENFDICDDDHPDTGDADFDDGDADYDCVDNDDANNAAADDVRLMMLHTDGVGADDADDADDASADATLGRHLIGQSACSAGRAERRSGRLTESLEATKSLS